MKNKTPTYDEYGNILNAYVPLHVPSRFTESNYLFQPTCDTVKDTLEMIDDIKKVLDNDAKNRNIKIERPE